MRFLVNLDVNVVLNKLQFLDAHIMRFRKKTVVIGSARPESRCKCIQWHGKCVVVFTAESLLNSKFLLLRAASSLTCLITYLAFTTLT